MIKIVKRLLQSKLHNFISFDRKVLSVIGLFHHHLVLHDQAVFWKNTLNAFFLHSRDHYFTEKHRIPKSGRGDTQDEL